MSTTRRAAALLGAVLLGLAGALLWSSAAHAATTAAPATVTITFAASGLTGATVTPSPATVPAGRSIAFKNADTTTLTVTAGSKILTTVPAGAMSAAIVLTTVGTVSYTASSPVVALGSIVVGTRSVTGSVSVTSAPASPPPVSHPSSTAPSARPTSGAPGSTPAGGGGSVPGASSGGSAPFSISYPGGGLGSIAPQPTGSGSVLAPIVAPYATSTAPNGVPTTLFTTYTPSPAGFATGGGGGSGRALGLTAAVTAVLLAGLAAAFGRLLLAHPAGRGAARHR